MVATINRALSPTGPDGTVREPTFVRAVDANGNDISGGGTATTRLISAAASDNATVVKSAAGTVAGIIGYNDSVSARWLKLYDKASVPASTDTPRETIYLPAKAGFAFDNVGFFATGVGFRITTGSADNDTGSLTAADILGLNVRVL
jgi:hypothetical protein